MMLQALVSRCREVATVLGSDVMHHRGDPSAVVGGCPGQASRQFARRDDTSPGRNTCAAPWPGEGERPGGMAAGHSGPLAGSTAPAAAACEPASLGPGPLWYRPVRGAAGAWDTGVGAQAWDGPRVSGSRGFGLGTRPRVGSPASPYSAASQGRANLCAAFARGAAQGSGVAVAHLGPVGRVAVRLGHGGDGTSVSIPVAPPGSRPVVGVPMSAL